MSESCLEYHQHQSSSENEEEPYEESLRQQKGFYLWSDIQRLGICLWCTNGTTLRTLCETLAKVRDFLCFDQVELLSLYA